MNGLKEFVSRAFLKDLIKFNKREVELYESGEHPWQKSSILDKLSMFSLKERSQQNLERARFDYNNFKYLQKVRIAGIGLVSLAPIVTAIALKLLAH